MMEVAERWWSIRQRRRCRKFERLGGNRVQVGRKGRGGGRFFIFKPGFDSLIMANSINSRAAQWHEFAELHATSDQNGTHTSFQKVEALCETGMDPVRHDSFLLPQAHFAELHLNSSFTIR